MIQLKPSNNENVFCEATITAFNWKDAISGVRVSPGSAEKSVRRGEQPANKWSFNRTFSQQHLHQNLSESDDLRQSYSMPSQCRCLKLGVQYCCTLIRSAVFTCIGALGNPSRTGPLARKYLPGFPYTWSLRRLRQKISSIFAPLSATIPAQHSTRTAL